MPRHPRVNEPGLLYHIISRGNNRQEIFFDEGDYRKFLSVLQTVKEKYPFNLYAYILMPTHFHFLLEMKTHAVSRVMQSILTLYSKYHNWIHNRKGHLFQGRYRAIICEKENYFLELVRYIHLNAVRANLVKNPDDWKWSGHGEYSGNSKNKLIDKKLLVEVFGEGENGFEKYMDLICDGTGIELGRKLYPGESSPFLGSAEFRSNVVKDREKEKKTGLDEILGNICFDAAISRELVLSRSKKAVVSKVRKEFIRRSIEFGYIQAEIARFLGYDNAYISRVLSS
jgi:putative transposase